MTPRVYSFRSSGSAPVSLLQTLTQHTILHKHFSMLFFFLSELKIAHRTFNLLTQTVNSAAASHLKHFMVANVLKAAQFQTRRSSLLDKELQAAHLHLLSEVTSSFQRGTAVCRGQLLPGFFIKMTKTAAAGVL